MKVTADFSCLLEKEEQKIKEGDFTWKSSKQLTDLLFQLEEKDYDLAILLCTEYKKKHMIDNLTLIKEDYLNTDYDNLEERKKFLIRHRHCNYLNPLRMPNYLEGEFQYRKQWENKKLVSEKIQDIYYSRIDYQVLLGLEKKVGKLHSHWINQYNYLRDREEMEEEFHHLCNLPSNFNSTLAASSAAADQFRSAVVVAA